jgi:hypothetical protein
VYLVGYISTPEKPSLAHGQPKNVGHLMPPSGKPLDEEGES